MDLYIKLSVCVPRLIPGRGFYAQISSEITSEFPGVTAAMAKTLDPLKSKEENKALIPLVGSKHKK